MLRQGAFKPKYLAYGYSYKTYAFFDDTDKLEVLWVRKKSKKTTTRIWQFQALVHS